MKTIYSCSKCGAQFPKWNGKCLDCGAWGTLDKETFIEDERKSKTENLKDVKVDFIDLSKIKNEELKKIKTGLIYFDKVIGGGLVSSSLILLGGEPGIGKSTIISQIINKNLNTLYVSGEENANSVKSRFDRLEIDIKSVKFLAENNIETILAGVIKIKPDFLIIDSIQTLYTSEVEGDPGGVAQVRACTVKIMEIARKFNIATLIISHVNKSGDLAGPKTMEHLVDCVLNLEGDRLHRFRILKCIKNRFGATDESAILEMTKLGFKEVINPSKIYLSSINPESSGTAITSIIEGNQVLMLELQALVSKTNFGYPKRTVSGYDQKRLELLIAVLQSKLDLKLNLYDVYINLTGGFKVSDRALDLAVAMAVYSSYENKKIINSSVFFGEVGLSGEIRQIPKTKERIKEAVNLGFKNIIIPSFDKSVEIKGAKLNCIKDIKELKKFLV